MYICTMKVCNTINFLKELKSSYHKNELIYTEGSCFRLYSILKTIFPQANPYYSIIEGHWIVEIDDKFYDINGEICFDYVQHKKYEKVTDETVLTSAYIPTYKRQSTSYNKYKKDGFI